MIETKELLIIVAVLAGVYLLITFSNKESMSNLDTKDKTEITQRPVKKSAYEPASYPIENEATISSDDKMVNEIVAGKPQVTTDDLLPKYDQENEFAKQNPVTNLLKEQNFLISGYHVGVNTVMQSNKIPYHDLRSAPPIPKENVGPFLQSSYENPMGSGRRTLEVGL